MPTTAVTAEQPNFILIMADDMGYTDIGCYGSEIKTPVLDRLAENGLRREDIRSWAIHPGGPRVIDAVQETLGLDASDAAASREVLAEYGNMSSPTVLFILERLAAREARGPCVVLAFGPGLVVEAALLH